MNQVFLFISCFTFNHVSCFCFRLVFAFYTKTWREYPIKKETGTAIAIVASFANYFVFFYQFNRQIDPLICQGKHAIAVNFIEIRTNQIKFKSKDIPILINILINFEYSRHFHCFPFNFECKWFTFFFIQLTHYAYTKLYCDPLEAVTKW